MNAQLWWYVARATGIVAWALLTTSVISGALFSTRLMRGRPNAAWQLDLHRFLGGSAVVFTGLHLGALVADNYVDFRTIDVLVPFASTWKPGPVALGVVSLYLLVGIELTSLMMRRLSRRLWHSVHLTAYGLFWLTTLHFMLAGSDAANPLARWCANLVVTAVVFLTLVRALSPGPRVRSASSATGVTRSA
jgi:DMSO/TMAO reductase YedYZ heme-binding membrane subunit